MKKHFLIAALIAVAALFTIAAFSSRVGNDPGEQNGKIKAAASFYPLAFLAEAVGGESVEVINMTPAGAEPHDFEPAPRDLATIYETELFLFNGAGLDPWAEKIAPEIANQGIKTLSFEENASLLPSAEDGHEHINAHACLHLEHGPAQKISAGPKIAEATGVSKAHTRFDVTGNGYLVFTPTDQEKHLFYLDKDIHLEILDSTGNSIKILETKEVKGCPQALKRVTAELQPKQYTLSLSDNSNFSLVIESASEEEHEHADHEEEGGHNHAHGEFDPHFWLDPILAANQAQAIADALSEINPQKKENYQANSKNLIDRLNQLDEEFTGTLESCNLKTFVTSHAAFGYLANRYGLEQIPISGLSPNQEPSARKMAEIAELAEQKNIRYIFFESLISPRLSETIAAEISAQTLKLNPIEGLTAEEIAAGKNYLSEMQTNLNNLRTALECR